MKKTIFLVVLSILIFGCSSNQENALPNTTNEDYSQYIINSSIPTNIKFLPEEIYNNYSIVQPPTLKLKLITTTEYPCINYGLTTSQFTNGNTLIVRFEGVFYPGICLTAIGPATKHIDLPTSITKLVFLNGSTIDKYDISTTNEKVQINLIQSSFTQSLYDNTFRYPDNSFAYVCGTNTNNTQLYTDFLNILLANNTLTEIYFQGSGRIPYPTTTMGNWVNHPSRYFRYNNQADFDALGPVLNNFKNTNVAPNSGVTINLYSWNNKNLY
jgi:hypothetical protein